MTGTGVRSAKQDGGSVTRPVSSVTFGLGGVDAFERALALSVDWMVARNAAIPHEAWNGDPFDIGGGGVPVARATWLDYEDGRVWSATVDDPDANHVGRIWITEITIAEWRGETHFGARLLNFTRGDDRNYVPSVPRLVRDLIGNLPCLTDGEILSEHTRLIGTADEVAAACALLQRTDRRLPVIILAEGIDRPPCVPLETLTTRLAGAVHVLGLKREGAELFTRMIGQDLAVSDGAVRMYRPGLRFEDADPYEHPLWQPQIVGRSTDGSTIIASALATGIAKGTTDYPRFDAVRRAASEAAMATRRARHADAEADVIRLLEQQNASLREDLLRLNDEQNQWLADAESVRTSAEQQIAELRADLHRSRAQNSVLREALTGGGPPRAQRPELTEFDALEAWSGANLSARIWISPKAIKETERRGQYRSPSELGEALYALDELYVPMRLHPGGDALRAWQDRMAALGMSVAPCFTRDGDLQRFPEYAFQYRGEKRWCDLHLKRGGGADPKSMFRIYFTWEADEQILLIGHMPSHLDNNMTN